MSLTAKKQRFCEEYIKDLNAGAAAGRAGYSTKGNSHFSHGFKLLNDADVQAEISRLNKARQQSTGITPERVLLELWRLATVDVGEVLDFEGDNLKLRYPKTIPESARRAISSVKVKRYLEGSGDEAREVELTEFKFADKTRSLELLGKHLNLFADRLKLEVSDDYDVSKLSTEDRDKLLAAIEGIQPIQLESGPGGEAPPGPGPGRSPA